MFNFDKEYIDLCKNEKVQGVRSNFKLHKGDWYVDEGCCPNVINCECYKGNNIWLPTGDQLDDEIVKICNKNKWNYLVTHFPNIVFCEVMPWSEHEIAKYSADSYITKNPLIAKISLLIKLLETP